MENLQTMSESIKSLVEKEPDEKKAKAKSDVNLETLDRTGFMQTILGEVKGMLEDVVKPVKEKVKDVDDRGIRQELDRQVKIAVEDHPDFWEWKDEMGNIAKRSPGLTVEECYQLARSQDKKKATEMDERFKSEEKKREEEKAAEEKAKEKEPAYGGLTPTSGKTVEVDDMTMEDAAEKAFDDVFGADAP